MKQNLKIAILFLDINKINIIELRNNSPTYKQSKLAFPQNVILKKGICELV